MGTPASLPNADSLQLQPALPWAKEHEGDAFMGWFQPPLVCLQVQNIASVFYVNV